MKKNKSDIAQFRQEQAMQEQAAQQGLHGFAVVAPHRTITARLEQDAPYLLELLEAGKIEQCDQAVERMTRQLQGLEEGENSVCHTMIERKNDG